MDTAIVVVAQYFFLFSIAIAGFVWLRLPRKGKWTLAIAGIGGGLLALGLITLAGALYYGPRPFVVEHIHPLFAHAADNGFPSDHATLTMFIAVCVLFYSRPWGVAAAANALLVGLARILAHVHSPVEIIAGYLIGAIAALAALWLAPRIAGLIPATGSHRQQDSPRRSEELSRPHGS